MTGFIPDHEFVREMSHYRYLDISTRGARKRLENMAEQKLQI